MKIKILESTRAIIAGNKTLLLAGEIHTLADDDAKRLISFGIAEEVKEKPKKKTKVIEPECKE